MTFQGFEKYGFNVAANGDITYREWAPNATEAFLTGDFSMYLRRNETHKLCSDFGIW